LLGHTGLLFRLSRTFGDGSTYPQRYAKGERSAFPAKEVHPMPAASILPLGPEIRIRQLTAKDPKVEIEAESIAPTARCPRCGTPSDRVHSRYRRTLRDLPWAQTPAVVHLIVRRFRCRCPSCPAVLFTERLPDLAPPYARATTRRMEVETVHALGAGGEGGRRLLQCLGVTVSADTLLRRARRAPEPPPTPASVVGIDDWAWRKGQRYGTVVVDLMGHRVLDLLADREANTVAQWLKRHPEVEVLSRDRAGAYAEAGRQGAPGAIQVADRFHLAKNAGDALERVVERVYSALVLALPSPGSSPQEAASPPPPKNRPPTQPMRRREEAQARRQARYDAIQERLAQGKSLRAIGLELGLARKTVRRYAQAPACPTPTWRRRPHALDPFRAYLAERWAAGVHNAQALYIELRARGFRGSPSALRQYLRPWRRGGGAPERSSGRPPSPKKLAILLTKEPQALTEAEAEVVRAAEGASAEVAEARRLVLGFRGHLGSKDASALGAWIREAAASPVNELRNFAASLMRDRAAVVAAVCLPWSNGPVEGFINRLKAIKRAMYGRGKLDLLRKRVMACL
jgi:transposase